jgi:hypothetical protein
LPTTRLTSGIAAKLAGSICAAQPVTTISAPGRARRARRIAVRVAFTAALVTAQLLITTVSRPATSVRIVSLSAMLRRQPRVMTSGAGACMGAI